MRRSPWTWGGLGLIGLLTTTAPLVGQTCLAQPDLNDFHAVVLAGGVGLYDGGHTFSGKGTFGEGVFAVAAYHYDDRVGTDDAGQTIEGGLGVRLFQESGVVACGLATAGYSLGLDEGVRSYDLAPALAVAYTDLIPRSAFALVPGARFGVVYNNFSDDAMSSLDEARTDSFLEIALGLVGPDGRWGVRPSVLLLSQGGDDGRIFRIELSVAGGS